MRTLRPGRGFRHAHRSSRWCQWLSALLALTACFLGSAAGASEQAPMDERAAIATEGDWATGNDGHALWFWPEQRRAYQLATGSRSYFADLRSYDVDTRQEVVSTVLNPSAWGTQYHSEYASSAGRHHVGAVDRENGRIFIAYRAAILPEAGTLEAPAHVARGGNNGCPGPGGLADPGCVGGIHVLDAETLTPIHRIPLSPASPEMPRLEVIPRALTYAPAVPEAGWGGRVLMVVEEIGNGPTENSVVPALVSATQNAVPRRNSGNLAYAVQFDPDTGRQDWAVRLEGCRNSREARSWMVAAESHPISIFRTAGAAPALFVGCHGNPSQQGVVVRVPLDDQGTPAGLPLRAGELSTKPEGDPATMNPIAVAPRQETFVGPDSVSAILSDPASGRILMRVDDSGEVWWVFDTKVRQFLGTVGIGDYAHGHTTAGLDPDTGRLYVVAATATDTSGPGGLYTADIRRNPLPQALHYPEFADPPRSGQGLSSGGGSTDVGRTMSVLPRAGGDAARIYVTVNRTGGQLLRVLVDASPVAAHAVPGTNDSTRTLDIDEAPDVTTATFDGTARGFGFRTILIGGAEGMARVGPADPIGLVRGVPQMESQKYPGVSEAAAAAQMLPRPDPCSDAQRELIMAFVGPRGPAVVDASSSRGEAQPLVADVRTREDVETPTRCLPMDWQQLWQSAMFGRPPAEEPGVSWPFSDSTSSCTTASEDAGDSWSDPVLGTFASEVSCSEDAVDGWGQARGLDLPGVSVATALSSFRIYRDGDRGMVARVESIARGVDLGGLVKIDTIRGVAESWANGRQAPGADEAGAPDQFNPFNCDRTRPAGTCFERHIFGVSLAQPDGAPAYHCGPCGPERELLEAMNRALGAYGYATFRDPDPDLARGAEDGYLAAITKRDSERFADIVLNNDLLETMVPMLEVVRFAPHNRPDSYNVPSYTFGTPPRGRQVYQFAGVEVSSTYGIQCLLTYDENSKTCGAVRPEPASITISLSDQQGQPLAGGAFQVSRDEDGDRLPGLRDALVPGGACLTNADGVGTCTFDGLVPGGYLVSQVTAPEGYEPATEPVAVVVEAGEARTLAFTNSQDTSEVQITAKDEAGNPLAGATFAVYPDPDADGRIAPDTPPAASCTTDDAGTCSMRVRAGAHVLVQTSAPPGLAVMEPTPFTFASGGQIAEVDVLNVRQEQVTAQPGPAPAPAIRYSAPPPAAAPGSTSVPHASVLPPRTAPAAAIGGTIVRVVRAPGDTLRLLSRAPLEALALSATFLLMSMAILAVTRRRQAWMLLAAGAGSTTALGPSTRGKTSPPGSPPVRHVGRAPVAAFRGSRVRERPVVSGAAPEAVDLSSVSVLIAISFAPLASVVRERLEAHGRCPVVATVASVQELQVALAASRPDVLVLDLALLPGSAAAWRILEAGHPAMRTVCLVRPHRSSQSAVIRAYRAGVGALLGTDEDLAEGQLAYAVRSVARGRAVYGPSVQALLLDEQRGGPRKRGRKPERGLTERELEIARMAAEGIRRGEIAEHLYLSPQTVKRHLRSVRAKLGVTNSWDHEEIRRKLEEAGVIDDWDAPASP